VPIPLGIAIASAAAIGFLYLLARWALYHPSKYPQGYWDTQQLAGAADAWLETSDGVKIHGWWVRRDNAPLATLFLHGNGDNLSYYMPYIQETIAAGSSVLMIDYRGYGRSAGSPSEQGLYHDSDAGYTYLLDKGYRAEQIIIYGQSLGSAVAIDLASRRPCAGLILEAPFSSASDVAGSLVPFIGPLLVRSYNSLPKIRGIRAPKLFIHGDRDGTIPFKLGRKLFDAAPEPKTLWIVPGAGHNDILEVAGAEYQHRLSAFYQSLLNSHS
jgi:fermentation-respiration switch protein FrsA (DUF1100 family)